ncbi:putative IMPACT (imprinted ancient) family translation regulator [Nakamurella sp. UYEF19]|uniref:IMPACT family protein n=1 Tax=Nakamurella sp. UYEF19 TaxID=1756392 RepID=UPI003396DDCA
MDFLTIAAGRDVRHEVDVKKSRFLTVLRRMDSETDAKGLVEEQRRLLPDARHHCWAFVAFDEDLGTGSVVARSGDDGEPSGTAGMPMLQALQAGPPGQSSSRNGSPAQRIESAGLVNVAAVVSRYFGGTLLGTGGLIRAYSGAVANAVDMAVTVRRRRSELAELAVDHAVAGRVESELRARGVRVLGVRYDDRAILTLAVTGELSAAVAAITSGEGLLRPAGFRWMDE